MKNIQLEPRIAISTEVQGLMTEQYIKLKNLTTVGEIETVSGQFVNVFEPKVEMFRIEDIASALSKVSRFNGHTVTEYPYSVAQHSIWVCEYLLDQGSPHAFTGLMHDATEAYLCDVPRPIKNYLPEYKILETKLDLFMSNIFGYQSPKPKDVTLADNEALCWEFVMFKNQENSELIKRPNDNRDRFIELYHQLAPTTFCI